MTGTDDTVEECYRINVYFPALDNIIQETEMRFGEKQKEVMRFYRVISDCMKLGDWDSDTEERK